MSKIVFINSLGLGGAERVVSRLFNDDFFIKNVKLWTITNDNFYNLTDVNHRCFKRKKLFPTFLQILIGLFRLESTTDVQAHLNKAILFSGISKIIGAKFRFQAVHCFAYSGYYRRKGIIGSIHKLLFSVILKKADFHIFKSHEMVDDFFEVFGWKPRLYSVIYNPYNIEEIQKLSYEKLDIDCISKKNVIDIAIVGRLNISKRPYDILQVAKHTNSTARYHFLGDGPLSQELEIYVEKHKIDNVVFHGGVSNPFKYLRKFGVYLSCSESEGFPNSLIEALLCDAVVIHSDCKTGPKEILCSNYLDYRPISKKFSLEKRGILFPVGDIEALISAINYTKENYHILKSGYENNYEFLSNINVDTITNIYKNTLGK